MRDEDSVRCIARTSAFSALQSALHCEKSSSSARSCSAGASSPIDTMSTSNGNESCSRAPLLSLQAKEATLASCVTAACELHRRLRALQQVLHERRPQFAEMKRTIMIMLGWISRGHSCLQQPQLVEICLGTFARQGAWTNMIHATDTCDVSAKLPRWWSWISRSCFASSSSLSSILVW